MLSLETFYLLEKELQKVGSPVIEYLNQPITDTEIRSLFSKTPFQTPSIVNSLYSWRNGTRWLTGIPLGHLVLFPWAMFIPLEHAIEAYQVRNSMDEYWTKDMFPIFDFGGDFHLINLNSNSPSFGQIFFYASGLEFDSMISIYDNLDSCIHSIIDCYQKNIYFLNEDGFIDKDIQVELSVGTRFNPNSEYWKFYTQYF